MKDPVLHHALSLAKRRKYGQAISLLESEIIRYRSSFRFYYILSLSCLYTGDYGRAYTYLKSAHDIKNKDNNVLLGIAAINMKRGESGRAVDFYLKVLESEPYNKIAQKALRVLRKYAGSEELADWIASGKIKKVYPPFPKEKNLALTLFISCLSAILALALVFFIAVKIKLINLPDIEKEQRPGFASSALQIDDKDHLVELGGSYQTILTQNDVLKYYENARKFFNDYDDNQARREINRIMHSNASEGIKNKAEVLLLYMNERPLDFDTLKTNFAYQEISRNPSIYEGCTVIWKGMATNITSGQNNISFDFLVGHETRTNLLGIVRVNCPFAAHINSEDPLEILGQIILDPEENSFTLTGVTLHQQKPALKAGNN
ncbi:MAG: tetratricopeptide repeat protein [Spirochaetaceae bacterium]|jgi:tetratricopeptide (TPR) repeat protein|nr:tetratricopeptide repeat protein [Spirochaetaceae bacterium]